MAFFSGRLRLLVSFLAGTSCYIDLPLSCLKTNKKCQKVNSYDFKNTTNTNNIYGSRICSSVCTHITWHWTFSSKLSFTDWLEMNKLKGSLNGQKLNTSSRNVGPLAWIFEGGKGLGENEISTKRMSDKREEWGEIGFHQPPAHPKPKRGGSVNDCELMTVSYAPY